MPYRECRECREYREPPSLPVRYGVYIQCAASYWEHSKCSLARSPVQSLEPVMLLDLQHATLQAAQALGGVCLDKPVAMSTPL